MTATKAKTTPTKKKSTAKKAATPAATLDDLLGGKPAASFPPDKLAGKAHWRWNKDQLHEAFLLFDASAQRARAVADATTERTSLNRAAITLFRSKRDPAEARRRLREVIDHYRAHPDDSSDRHFVDWAMTSLLEGEAERAKSPAAFTKAYRAGVAEALALLAPHGFPRIHTERLIAAAKRAGATAIVAELEESEG